MIIRHPPPTHEIRGWPFFRIVVIYAILPWAALFICMGHPPMAAGKPKPGTILSPVLNMRSGPGLHHPSIDKLRRGDRVLILSYEGEWVRILFKERTGFIMNRTRYLRIEEPETTPPQNHEQESGNDTVKRELEASTEKLTTFSKKESAIVSALEETEQALDKARKKVIRLRAELAAVDRQIATLEGQYLDLEDQAAQMEQYVAGRLAALYKLSWIGKFHLMASADSMVEFILRKRSLEQILGHDEMAMAKLAQDKAKMKVLLNRLVEHKHAKQTTTADLSAKINTMNAKQAQRESLLTEIKDQKSLQRAVIESLKASAKELDRTVKAFGTDADQAPEVSVVVGEKPFAALKGLLMMPVKGKIVSFFGPFKDRRLNVTNFQSGITIKADRGEPIRAVYSGQTLFSSWFRGFGNMIIIDHGDHYYTVYAHLEELFKAKGDPVETGEVIATVGDTGSLTGAGLHFEVRHHGKPTNPMGWIKKG